MGDNPNARTLGDGEAAACLFNSEYDPARANLRCPGCGSDYTHVRQAGTLLGSDEYEAVVYPGTEKVGATGDRRSSVAVTFDCEMCPCLFSLVVTQHKGWSRVEVRVLPEVRVIEPPPPAGPFAEFLIPMPEKGT